MSDDPSKSGESPAKETTAYGQPTSDTGEASGIENHGYDNADGTQGWSEIFWIDMKNVLENVPILF